MCDVRRAFRKTCPTWKSNRRPSCSSRVDDYLENLRIVQCVSRKRPRLRKKHFGLLVPGISYVSLWPRADSAAIGSAVRKVWAEWHHHTTRVGIVKL